MSDQKSPAALSFLKMAGPGLVVAATGIGSWPGTSARQAAEIVVGELHTLPHLVELPARGVGADLIGRTLALLGDDGQTGTDAPGRFWAAERVMRFLAEVVEGSSS